MCSTQWAKRQGRESAITPFDCFLMLGLLESLDGTLRTHAVFEYCSTRLLYANSAAFPFYSRPYRVRYRPTTSHKISGFQVDPIQYPSNMSVCPLDPLSSHTNPSLDHWYNVWLAVTNLVGQTQHLRSSSL